MLNRPLSQKRANNIKIVIVIVVLKPKESAITDLLVFSRNQFLHGATAL